MLQRFHIRISMDSNTSYFLQIRLSQNKNGLMKYQQSFSRIADSFSIHIQMQLGSHLQ